VNDSLLDAALYHYETGCSCISVRKDKKPYRYGWNRYFTERQTEVEVREEFSNGVYGIAEVLYPASKHIHLDYDGHCAEEGLRKTGINLPETARFSTPNGLHDIFKVSPFFEKSKISRKIRLIKVACNCKKDGKPHPCGVDLLVNGYSVIPPTPGYTEDADRPLENAVEIPDALVKLALEEHKTKSQNYSTDGDRYREGERNGALTSLAGSMRRRDMSFDSIFAALKVENKKKCDPPLDEREVEAIARSVSRYQPGNEKHGEKKPKPSTGESATNRKGQAEFWPELLSAKDILSLPPDLTRWAWDGILPFSSGSLLVSKAKVGKTSEAANLTIAIARGVPFLGRDTIQCPVAYLSLDASLPEIAETFISFGLRESDPVFIHAGAAPKDAIRWVTQRIREKGVRFVVVDTLQRLFRFQNLNDYSEVTNTLEPLLEAIREQKAHVMFLHHAKKEAGDDLDSAIGSTAIRGLAYTYLHLKRLPNSERRILRSDQRGGKNFSELQIGFGRGGWLEVKGTMEEAEIEEAIPKIVEAMEVESAELTEREIRRLVPLRGIIVSKAVRQMFKTNTLERTGHGKRGKPLRYSLSLTLASSPNSCPRVGGMGGGNSGHESPNQGKTVTGYEGIRVPERSDTDGTQKDTNRKTDDFGYESREREGKTVTGYEGIRVPENPDTNPKEAESAGHESGKPYEEDL